MLLKLMLRNCIFESVYSKSQRFNSLRWNSETVNLFEYSLMDAVYISPKAFITHMNVAKHG